jgi:hypothetical protein
MMRREASGSVGARSSGAPTLLLRALIAAVLIMVLVLSAGGAITTGAGPARAGTIAPLQPRVYQGGGVIAFGNARSTNTPIGSALSSVMVAMATNPVSTPENQGYWLAAADGGVFAQGNAGFYGSLGALRLQGPVVGMAPTSDGRGYWLVALDGGVFSFGDANFFGSMGATRLNQPVVGMAATPDGLGYWLVAADGGIFSFGDANFFGSMGAVQLAAPVAGMASTADGRGYWMVAADGGVFTFGDAAFYGSMGGQVLNDPVVGIAPSPHGAGYLLVATDGGIFGFGRTSFFGSLGGGYGGNPTDVPPVAGIALTPDAQGYWLLEPDGWSYAFTNPPSPAPSPTASAIVSAANRQVNSDQVRGQFCNPYGPCEEWCALFATWVWQQAGVPIPSFAFIGSVYDWAASHTGVLPSGASPVPGDAVLYGTGPASPATSIHMGIVTQVWPDGAVVTIEGDAGPAPTGSLAVVINGPYLPSESAVYNGMPIYAYALP